MKARKPRSGSMQFWPRKRAKKPVARVRSWPEMKEAKPAAFAGYKAGMTHVIATDAHKHSPTKGQDISIPATIIECPPMFIYSARLYQKKGYGEAVSKDIIISTDKDLTRKISLPKNKKKTDSKTSVNEEGIKELENIKPEEYSDITIICYTKPRKTGIKKKPDMMEVRLGGTNEEKITFIKEHAEKGFSVKDIFTEGEYIDLHAITKGKGFQGAVKRFGIGLKSHKSEKGRRAPGSLGGWTGHAHFMYRIAHAGQMGYHQRTQYNNQILKISDNPEEVNQKGGILRYGLVKNTYLLVRGSVPGPKKRLITMVKAIRPKQVQELPTIQKIITESAQGR